MSIPGQQLVHESGAWELDLDRGELRGRGVTTPLAGRAFEIFAVLAEKAGDLVGKDELMRRVWPGAIVEENTLQAHISAIRKVLGNDRDLLKTLSGKGYRLLGTWEPRSGPRGSAGDNETQHASADRSNIPAALSEFVGRTVAALHLADVLSTHRAVTLTGPGGIGKTTLGLEVARKLLAGGKTEAYVVDLGPLTDPGLVPSTIAAALALKPGGGEVDLVSVARAIGDRTLLLILDTCEHLIEAAAAAAETVMQMCPRVTVLATSRENLRIEGEYVYRLSPLGVPAPTETDAEVILAQDSVRLFLAKTSRSDSRPPNLEELLLIASICRDLDGIPLAIEFAASRAATLGLRQVAVGLNDRFGLLITGRRTALPRHQTLHATLDWSYELLPDAERRLLRRLSIFPAGFTAAAAAAVVGVDGRGTSEVIDGVANLVEKSLVTFDGPPSAGRWRMLDTIRAYGLEKLVDHQETEDASLLAAEYLLGSFRSDNQASHGQIGTEPGASGRREIDNVRAAIDWALSTGDNVALGLELTAASAPLWFRLTLMLEYRARVQRALQILLAMPDPDEAIEMRLQAALGHALWYSGPGATTNEVDLEKPFTRALELAERIGDKDIRLQALWSRWATGRARGDEQGALEAATRYEEAARPLGDPRATVLADRMLALTYHDLGNPRLAAEHVENVLRRSPHLDPATNSDLQVDARVSMLAVQTRVLWLQGYPEQAGAVAEEAIATAMRMDSWFAVCYVLNIGACPLSLWVGDLDQAKVRSEMIRERAAGNQSWLRHAGLYNGILELRRSGDAVNLLTAAYFEARVQFSMTADLIRLMAAKPDLVLHPETLPSEAGWSLPEILRVDAELLLRRGDPASVALAESKLERSLQVARSQAAPSWELRTAISLARLRANRNQRREASALLASVYEKFTEGFQTLDLHTAKALLDSLA